MAPVRFVHLLLSRQVNPNTTIPDDPTDSGYDNTSVFYKYAFVILGVVLLLMLIIRALWIRRLARHINQGSLNRRRASASSVPPYSLSDSNDESRRFSRLNSSFFRTLLIQPPPVVRRRDCIGPLTEVEYLEVRRRREERRVVRMQSEEGYGLPSYSKSKQEGEETLESGYPKDEDDEELGIEPEDALEVVEVPTRVHLRV